MKKIIKWQNEVKREEYKAKESHENQFAEQLH